MVFLNRPGSLSKSITLFLNLALITGFFVLFLYAFAQDPDSPITNPGSEFDICTDTVSQPSCYTTDSPTPTLKWTFASDNDASTQEAYWVQIDNSGNHEGDYPSPEVNTDEVASSDTEYTVPADKLEFNTTYYWKVAVKDNFDTWSGWTCAEDTFTTANICPPDVPSGLSATASYCNQIDLSWTDNSSDEDGFEIGRKLTGGSWAQLDTVDADVTSYSDTTVSESTKYFYHVRAYKNGVSSDWSNADNLTTAQCSLSVSLAADPSSGYLPLEDVDLTATVVSNILGTFNYTFYCNRSDSGTNVTDGWAYKEDGTTDNPMYTFDVCDYLVAGAYSAKVIAEQGALAAEDRETITASSNPPTATNLQVAKGDYCSIPVHYFSWTYSDPDGDDESKFQFQVDDNSDFSSPEIDREQTGTWHDGDSNNQTVLVVESPTTDRIVYNTTYYWRVKVYDDQSTESDWTEGNSFTTEKHRYPFVDFSWSPQEPSAEEDVAFTDQSTVYGGASKASWAWTFEDGNPATSGEANPTVQFTTNGGKQVSLGVTDSDGFTCQATEQVGVQIPLPGWQEILPW